MNKSSRAQREIKRPARMQPSARGRQAARDRQVDAAIGLDLGDRQSYVCTLGDDGSILSESRVATTLDAMRQYFAGLCRTRVALEAGTHSGWASRLLRSLGHEVIVANPRELRKIHQSDRKNDRADAQILARMVRFDPKLLAPIEHRSAQMQADLTVVRARDALVGARTKCINAARGFVKAMGARLPKCDSASFPRRALEHVPEELHVAVLPLLDADPPARPRDLAAGDEGLPADQSAPPSIRSWAADVVGVHADA
jgi:transposase